MKGNKFVLVYYPKESMYKLVQAITLNNPTQNQKMTYLNYKNPIIPGKSSIFLNI